LYRGENEFKDENQSIINIIKDENVNLVADPQNVLNRWKNFFNQVLNVHGLHDVRQTDIHLAEPLVPETSLVEVEFVIGKFKRYKSTGSNNIPAEFMKAGVKYFILRYTDLFVVFGIRKNCQSSGRHLLL
jgi:hypothetical protein